MINDRNITLFGSARLREGSQEYQDIFTITRHLATLGISVSAVDGPGLMEAARRGANSVLRQNADDIKSTEVPLVFAPAMHQCHNLLSHFDQFTSRMEFFLSHSQALIVAPGGVGTVLELFYCLHSFQIKRLFNMPIVLFGDIWGKLLSWLKTELVQSQLIDQDELKSLIHLSTPEDVIALIEQRVKR